MRLAFKIALAVACVIFAASCSDADVDSQKANVDQVSLQKIIEQNSIALGGENSLDAIQSMEKRSNILEGEFDDETIFVVDRFGRMRVDIFAAGERVFAESYDGAKGHQWGPQKGQTPASVKGTVALSHTAQLPNHILRLKDMANSGHDLQYLESETIDGREYHVVQLVLNDGFKTYLFLDSITGFVTRSRNERALHVDVDDKIRVIEARMSDFRTVGDIVHPFKVEEIDLGTGEKLVDITLRSLTVNNDIPENYFTDLEGVIPNLN